MEMNYFKKTGKMMVAACMLAGLPFIPGTVSASELQTQMMSVQMESTTLKELFDLIEEKFNYTFLIRNNDINLNERISIDMSNRSVEEILTTALKNQHADFVVNNNRIVVYKSSSNPNELRNTERMVAQQTITISGTIVDAVTGEPVIGANVLVKGTTNGTSTDFDGKFSLEAPAGATLVVSYIGYVNHEVKATSAPMTIRIKEDTQNLEEVVVVGYGVQKKESLTGAMQVVSNEKLLDATSPTVENLLSGKAPGVQVTSGGGQPGAAGKVVIRGKSTVNGSTDPLWIVDGVIVGTDAGSLNPADIESMSILKDAASTAIYGSQGANGVIVVTTKKGKIGKATINASVKMGVNQLHRGNMNMMNGEELYDYYKSFANQDALPSYFTEDLRNRNFDWWKEGTHLGFAQDYNVSVSGGSEKIKTYTSVGYYNEDGAVKGYDYKRYNLRFNVDYQATDWLTIKPKVWATRSDVMDQQQDLGAIMYVNFPWDSPYDENGDLIQQYRPTDWVNSDATNYLYDLQWNYEKKTSYEFMGNFDFDIKFTDWLTFASVNSYKYNNILFKGYNDPRSKAGEADNGLLQDKTTTSYRVYSNQLLRFNKVFDKHSINAILAYEWNSYTREIKDQTAASFAPGFSVADVATTPKTIKGSQEEWAVQSYLFNANYAYDNRYLLSFSFVNGMPEDMDNLDLPDRSSVKDTYEQVLSDLKKAEELMSDFKSPAYASKYAAQALLAKVYMYMSGTFENPNKEYAQLSYNYANEVIESNQFSLLSRSTFMTYNELAPDAASQTETIFAVKFIASDWDDWGSPLGSMYAEIDGQGWGEVYASAKYMDLLHETGKNTDAREAFIHPQYKKNDAGDQIPAFRFVANLYTDGKISGYVYRQGETKEVGGKLIATVDDEEYTLTPVDVDNKRYSISYKGKTYVGDYDYLMLESQGNPKFYSYKCSKQEGYPHLYSPVISRLGELYLIRAEASAKLGNYTKALADLNTVRTRSLPNAGYKSLDATNAHELIMKERQLELAYEADRGFDVYRVGDTMKRHYPGFHDGVPEYPATSPLAIQYIPQSEINAYPGTLTQNP